MRKELINCDYCRKPIADRFGYSDRLEIISYGQIIRGKVDFCDIVCARQWLQHEESKNPLIEKFKKEEK